jgi:CHAT domain-containing protein
MTIGFSWGVDDLSAVDFAREFYSGLQVSPQVSSAFSSARHNLYNKFYNGNPIWAAAILIAQAQE